jgi:hypothetical protein
MSPEAQTNSSTNDGSEDAAPFTQKQRLEALKRAFQKPLRNRPTPLQRYLIDRAAALCVKAEMAIYNGTSANDIVRLDRAATKAREQMDAVLSAKPKRKRDVSDLEREIAAHG